MTDIFKKRKTQEAWHFQSNDGPGKFSGEYMMSSYLDNNSKGAEMALIMGPLGL